MRENKEFDLPDFSSIEEKEIPHNMTWQEMFLACEEILPYLNKDRDRHLELERKFIR